MYTPVPASLLYTSKDHMYSGTVKTSGPARNPAAHRRTAGSLHHYVASGLGIQIMRGKLVVGTILPNEADLCTKFSVSRTAVREGMKVLVSKGLVEVRRKTGTRVLDRSEWNMLDPEVLAWLLAKRVQPEDLVHLLDMRMMVEPAAARIAAERGSDEELGRISACYREMEAVADSIAESIEADLSFHLAILSATHNPFLRSFGALLKSVLRASFRFTTSNHDLYVQSLSRHQKVAEQIAARNLSGAEQAMVVVLRATYADISQQAAGQTRLAGKTAKKRPAARGAINAR